jgi:hypothetical protein
VPTAYAGKLTLWGLLAGFLLGLATELILEVAGG